MLPYLTNQLINQTPLLNDWSSIYTDGSQGTDVSSTLNTTARNDLSSYTNAYVHDCSFSDISSSGNGGVIYWSTSSSSNKLLVEYSSFNTCSSSDTGGAIYFSDEGQCVLSSVCGVKCNTGNSQWAQFC